MQYYQLVWYFGINVLHRPSQNRRCLAKKIWTVSSFFSPAKAELFIVVLLLPRNQSHFLPAYVSSHVDHSGIRWVHKQIQAALGFEPEASARHSAMLSTAPPVDWKILWMLPLNTHFPSISRHPYTCCHFPPFHTLRAKQAPPSLRHRWPPTRQRPKVQ